MLFWQIRSAFSHGANIMPVGKKPLGKGGKLCINDRSRIQHETEKRLARNELARFYHWKRRNRLAPLNMEVRRISSSRIEKSPERETCLPLPSFGLAPFYRPSSLVRNRSHHGACARCAYRDGCLTEGNLTAPCSTTKMMLGSSALSRLSNRLGFSGGLPRHSQACPHRSLAEEGTHGDRNRTAIRPVGQFCRSLARSGDVRSRARAGEGGWLQRLLRG